MPISYRGRMPSISVVAVGRLNEDGRVGLTLGEHLAPDVVEANALADMTSRVFDDVASIYVG